MARKIRLIFLFCFSCATFGFCYWLVYIALAPKLPDKNHPICFYSNQCHDDLKTVYLRTLNQAHQSIHLVMFGLTDPKIISTLRQKEVQDIPIQVFFDAKASLPLDRFLKKSEIIPVKSSALMHQKILVTDEHTVFLGSTNMTPSSMWMHDNFLIGIYNRSLAKFLTTNTPKGSGSFQMPIKDQFFKLWLLPDRSHQALRYLQKLIREAHSEIQIAMFTFTHPTLVHELIEAKKRGLQIKIIIDSQSGYGASMKAVQKLKEAGIDVYLNNSIQLMHHKLMVIDQEIFVSGSANWTKSAFLKNQDYFFSLAPLEDKQKKFCKNLFQMLETELTNAEILE